MKSVVVALAGLSLLVDPDGSIFWFGITTPTANGTLELYGGRKHRFRYTPNPAFTGVDDAFVQAQDDQGTYGAPSRIRFAVGTTVAVESGTQVTGDRLGARPNPIRAMAELAYHLAGPARVSLAVYDVSGKRLRTWDEGERVAGAYQVRWDARGARGRSLPSGVYVLELVAGSHREARPVVVTN